jgi:DNA polymerase-3 subunit beta
MPITSEITVKQPAFESAVKWAAKWVDAKPSVPVHAGLAIAALGTTLEVNAFSENVSARATVQTEGKTDPDGQRGVVSARLLAELAGTFAAGKPVVLAGDGKELTITSGRFRATLPTFSEDDFPALPGRLPTIGSVAGAAFADAVARVGTAAGQGGDVPMLYTMHLGFREDGIHITSTDGRRAARIEVTWSAEVTGEQATPLAGMLISAAAAFDGPDAVEIGLDGFNLSLTSPTRSLTMRLVDVGGQGWPVAALARNFDFAQSVAVELDPAELVRPLKRASIVRGKAGPVRLTFSKNTLTIGAALAEEHQQSADEIELDYDGPEYTVAVNPDYLTAALGSAPDGKPVQFGFTTEMNPMGRPWHVSLRSEADSTWRHVLMPVVI